MIRYCVRCVMPETRPHLHIDEQGVCNACRSYENRAQIDWDERRHQFLELVEEYRSLCAEQEVPLTFAGIRCRACGSSAARS